MVEVAIKSVEAVFDWKAYLKDTFGYEIDDSWLKDEEEEDSEEIEFKENYTEKIYYVGIKNGRQ